MPESETWTVATLWTAAYEGDPAAQEGTRETFPTWDMARSNALSLTCLKGTWAVKVLNADGDVIANWDRWSNLWREPR